MKRLVFAAVCIVLGLLGMGGVSRASEGPMQVYLKYLSAIKAGKGEEMVLHVASSKKAEYEKMDKAQKEQVMFFLQQLYPEKCTLAKEEVEGDRAVLFLEAEIADPFTKKADKAKGRVEMVKEAGQWKIMKDEWTSGPEVK